MRILTLIGAAVVALWLAGALGIGHFSLSYGVVPACTKQEPRS